MGTNYYMGKKRIHIGKTSLAGMYCYGCEKSMLYCEGMEKNYRPTNPHSPYFKHWNKCPKCGIQTTVAAHSFNWAMAPEQYLNKSKRVRIYDENNKTISNERMNKIIMTSRWVYFDSIGSEFS